MGLLAAVACYVYWGLIILYWKSLKAVSSEELMMHRIVWTLVLTFPLMRWRGSYSEYKNAFTSKKVFWWHCLAAALLACNWYLFVYGVTNDRVTDASLGYFLCPFVSVFWGRVVQKERLSRAQWVSIGLVAIGVGKLTLDLDELPLVALGIALTWGTFSMVNKRSSLGVFSGLGMEMTLLAPFALGFLIWFGMRGEIVWGTQGAAYDLLIASTGLVTMIPLLLFSYAVKRVTLTTMGLLQYLMPTIGLIFAVFVFHEPFGQKKLIAFSFIWAALILYGFSSWRHGRSMAVEKIVADVS